MIQLTTLPATGPIDAPRPAGSIPPLSADFALALGQLLAPAAGAFAPGAIAEMSAIARQTPAESGKDLPAVEATGLPVDTGTASIVLTEDVPAAGSAPTEFTDAAALVISRKAKAGPPTRIEFQRADAARPAATIDPETLDQPRDTEKSGDEPAVEAKPRRKTKPSLPDPLISTPQVAVDPIAVPEAPATGTAAPSSDGRARGAASIATTASPIGERRAASQASTPQSPPRTAARADTSSVQDPVDATAASLPTPRSTEITAAAPPASGAPEASAAPVIRLPAAPAPAGPPSPQGHGPGPAAAPLRPVTAAPKPQPQPALSSNPVAQPAARAFAAAIFAAERAAPAKREDAPIDPAGAFPLSGFATPAPHGPTAVHAAAQAHGAPLDTRRDDWMGQMIERIEMIRDEGGAREARIRLAPDALGRVDVAIRHDGETVHVHLTADTAAARTLLADAAPRLTEMAESRGLRLGGTGVEAGNPQAQSDARDPRQPAAQPRSPGAMAASEDHPEIRDDRVA